MLFKKRDESQVIEEGIKVYKDSNGDIYKLVEFLNKAVEEDNQDCLAAAIMTTAIYCYMQLRKKCSVFDIFSEVAEVKDDNIAAIINIADCHIDNLNLVIDEYYQSLEDIGLSSKIQKHLVSSSAINLYKKEMKESYNEIYKIFKCRKGEDNDERAA